MEVACSSCWSVVLVGSHMPSRPSAIAVRASVGRSQLCATTSPPSNVGSTPSGNDAAKNLASKRRGNPTGVTHRDSGTRRSVRNRRSSAAATSGRATSPRSSADRASLMRPSGARVSARSTPASSNSSRIAATCAAMCVLRGRGRPRVRPPRRLHRARNARRGLRPRRQGRPVRRGRRACRRRRPSSSGDVSAVPRGRAGRSGEGPRSPPVAPRRSSRPAPRGGPVRRRWATAPAPVTPRARNG